ncbi:MAG TPA: hypothetical protein VGF45_21960 [Polyangia bacterium]
MPPLSAVASSPSLQPPPAVLLAAIDMGYGHLRAAHALASSLGVTVRNVAGSACFTTAPPKLDTSSLLEPHRSATSALYLGGNQHE